MMFEVISKLVTSAIKAVDDSEDIRALEYVGVGLICLICCVQNDAALLKPQIKADIERIFGALGSRPRASFTPEASIKVNLREHMDLLQRRCPTLLSEETARKLYDHAA